MRNDASTGIVFPGCTEFDSVNIVPCNLPLVTINTLEGLDVMQG